MKIAKNLISHVRNLLTGVHRSAPSRRRTQSYEHVLEYLQHFCSTLPAGTELVFLLNGRNGEVRWRERTARLEPTPNKPEPPKQPVAAEAVRQEPATATAEVPPAPTTTDGKPSKQQQTMHRLLRFLRLRYAFLVTCTDVELNEDGSVKLIHCTYDPASRGGMSPDGRKVKGTIHWVSAKYGVPAKARLYDHLFAMDDPNDVPEGKTFLDMVNPDSLKEVDIYLENALQSLPVGETVQFERVGYFCKDKDSTDTLSVFNRTATLRDSWAKIEKKSTAGK